MLIVRIIFFVLLLLYLILAFVFMHISLNYQRQLVRSSESLLSLFNGQISLFLMLEKEVNIALLDQSLVQEKIEAKDYESLNKMIIQKEREYIDFLKTNNLNSDVINQLIEGLEENVVLIRNEVYRYNKIVENININCESLVFSLFVVILRLKHLHKI